MSKRIIDTDRWREKWFRTLKPSEKLLYIYLNDMCDNAGFYEMDLDAIILHTGMKKESILGAIEGLNRGLYIYKGIIWLKDYLFSQRLVPLNIKNNAHRQIIYFIKAQLENFPLIPKIIGQEDLFPEGVYVLNNTPSIEGGIVSTSNNITSGSTYTDTKDLDNHYLVPQGISPLSGASQPLNSPCLGANQPLNGLFDEVTKLKKTKAVKKIMYGEFCRLTADEHKTLVEDYGEVSITRKIDELNDYVGSTGKKYKSHYHTIRVWLKKEGARKLAHISKKSSTPVQLVEAQGIGDTMFDEIEKWKKENVKDETVTVEEQAEGHQDKQS